MARRSLIARINRHRTLARTLQMRRPIVLHIQHGSPLLQALGRRPEPAQGSVARLPVARWDFAPDVALPAAPAVEQFADWPLPGAPDVVQPTATGDVAADLGGFDTQPVQLPDLPLSAPPEQRVFTQPAAPQPTGLPRVLPAAQPVTPQRTVERQAQAAPQAPQAPQTPLPRTVTPSSEPVARQAAPVAPVESSSVAVPSDLGDVLPTEVPVVAPQAAQSQMPQIERTIPGEQAPASVEMDAPAVPPSTPVYMRQARRMPSAVAPVSQTAAPAMQEPQPATAAGVVSASDAPVIQPTVPVLPPATETTGDAVIVPAPVEARQASPQPAQPVAIRPTEQVQPTAPVARATINPAAAQAEEPAPTEFDRSPQAWLGRLFGPRPQADLPASEAAPESSIPVNSETAFTEAGVQGAAELRPPTVSSTEIPAETVAPPVAPVHDAPQLSSVLEPQSGQVAPVQPAAPARPAREPETIVPPASQQPPVQSRQEAQQPNTPPEVRRDPARDASTGFPSVSAEGEYTERPASVRGPVEVVRARPARTPPPRPAQQAPLGNLPPALQRQYEASQAAARAETPDTSAAEPEEELFQAEGRDRSPQAWVERLRRAARDEREAAEKKRLERLGIAPAPAQHLQPAAQSAAQQPGMPGAPVVQQSPAAAQALQQPQRVVGPPVSTASNMPQVRQQYAPAQPQAQAPIQQPLVAPPAPQLRAAPAVPPAQTRAFVPPARVRQAPPLPESTRRFLQPLVGVDPASVQVYRDTAADRIAASYRADAATTGDTIVVAAGHTLEEPRSLGLLAHELTHVARERDPRFVPPVLRDQPRVQQPGPQRVIPAVNQEEAIAQQVEARVTQAARVVREPLTMPTPEARVPQPVVPGVVMPPAVPHNEENQPDWDGLPAPWEPLPGWVTTPPAPAAMPAPMSAPQQRVPALAPRPAAPAPASAAPAPAPVQAVAPPVRLAEESRPLDQPAATPATPQAAEHAAPDIDALARQVYSVLKRRLAAERRRDG